MRPPDALDRGDTREGFLPRADAAFTANARARWSAEPPSLRRARAIRAGDLAEANPGSISSTSLLSRLWVRMAVIPDVT
jgi:hypothetical protein